jgi:hypothetical protein
MVMISEYSGKKILLLMCWLVVITPKYALATRCCLRGLYTKLPFLRGEIGVLKKYMFGEQVGQDTAS